MSLNLSKCFESSPNDDQKASSTKIELHAKLIGSYAMDIPISLNGRSGPDLAKVRKIFDHIVAAEEKKFPSVGLGIDCRYTTQGLVGSALAVDEWYVHMAFFRTSTNQGREPREQMSSMSRRRAYRSHPTE